MQGARLIGPGKIAVAKEVIVRAQAHAGTLSCLDRLVDHGVIEVPSTGLYQAVGFCNRRIFVLRLDDFDVVDQFVLAVIHNSFCQLPFCSHDAFYIHFCQHALFLDI